MRLRDFFFSGAGALAAVCFAHSQPAEVTAVLPNGREIHPAGNWIPLAPYPFVLAVRPDGRADRRSIDVGFPFALNIIDSPDGPQPKTHPHAIGQWRTIRKIEVHAGLVYSPDGSLIYAVSPPVTRARSSFTAPETVTASGNSPSTARSGGNNFGGSFAATLAISSGGKTLYALDQGNWRIVVIEHRTHGADLFDSHRRVPLWPRPLAGRQAALRHQHRSL